MDALKKFFPYSYKVKDHVANDKKTYGYKLYDNQEEFQKGLYELYMNEIVPAISNGLCGSVYTQLSDVEDEINGFFTYDRKPKFSKSVVEIIYECNKK